MQSIELTLRPSYWESVSGGKDSLFMLNLILHNLDKYPLDGVVHFELEIDYPFIKNVIDYMESECKRFGIRFVRIKPRKTWEELYYKKHNFSEKSIIYGFPNFHKRWCNGEYKMDAKNQLEEYLNSLNSYLVCYIGYCVDEEKRYKKRKQAGKTEIYPLVENNIREETILEWAKTEPIFNNYYKFFRRCGCMYCPMTTRLNLAYLSKYYPENYAYMMEKIRETEKIYSEYYGRSYAALSRNPKYNADYIENIIKTKWLKKLEEIENE